MLQIWDCVLKSRPIWKCHVHSMGCFQVVKPLVQRQEHVIYHSMDWPCSGYLHIPLLTNATALVLLTHKSQGSRSSQGRRSGLTPSQLTWNPTAAPCSTAVSWWTCSTRSSLSSCDSQSCWHCEYFPLEPAKHHLENKSSCGCSWDRSDTWNVFTGRISPQWKYFLPATITMASGIWLLSWAKDITVPCFSGRYLNQDQCVE